MNVVIIGGGISGLATGYLLTEKIGMSSSPEIKVLEADNRLGGKIWSEKTDGFLCERGPNGFLDNKPWTLELCEKLGIKDLLLRTNDSARKRFIYSNHILHQIPSTPSAFFLRSTILSFHGKLRILLEPFTRMPDEGVDETIASFAKRHIGEEALKKLVAPMVSGVFAGDPYRLSLKSSFPVMAELERDGNGSLLIAMIRRLFKATKSSGRKGGLLGPGGTLTSFKDGIEYLIHILGERLGNRIITGAEVLKIEKNMGEGYPYSIYFRDKTGESKADANVVILATPAYITSKLIEPLDPSISKALNEIPYPPLVVACFGYKRSLISHPLDGFGFLIPYEERTNILGCLWDSSMYESRAPEGYVLLRAMVGGASKPELADIDDDSLIKAVREDLRIILRIDVAPDFVRIYRHKKAIPQYTVGHSERMRGIENSLKKHQGLFLTGNSYYGIGINDCVREAFMKADKVIDYCSRFTVQD